jgi:hypothetical protein
MGPDTPPAGEQKQPMQLYQNQVAATAAAFLGVTYKSEKKVGASIPSAVRK